LGGERPQFQKDVKRGVEKIHANGHPLWQGKEPKFGKT